MNVVTEFSADLFAPHVGSTFEVVGGDGRRAATVLERVADRGGDAHSTMFALYFIMPSDGPNEQGTYRLEREGLGAVDLFMVPVGREGDGLVFEAAMNIFRRSEGGQ